MPGTVHFVDIESAESDEVYITADGVDKALEKLKRRDNIEEFIVGLVAVEVFPFPGDQKAAKPALMPYANVTMNPAKLKELTEIRYLGLTRSLDIVKNTTQILPDAGPRCYSEDRLVIARHPTDQAVSSDQAKSLRFALFSRYEWVASKIEDVNELRRRHCEEGENPWERLPAEDAVANDGDSELSEEVDLELMHEDESADEDSDEEEDKDIVFPLDQSLQKEIDEKIKQMVSGKDVLIVNALGNSHGVDDGHTDRPGRVKPAPAPAPAQGTKRSAEIDPVVHKCPLSQKKARIEALADIVGAMTTMLPGLANGEGECCFEAILEEFMNVVNHMQAYSAREKASLDVPDSDEVFNSEDKANNEDSDEVNSWYEVHGSQTYSSQSQARRQSSKEL